MRPFLAALALTLVGAWPAHAYLEETASGARVLGLGPSGMAMVADVSAYHWDPAALVSLLHPEVMVDYSKPDGVADLTENTIAFGGVRRGTGLAVAWHHLGLNDVYGEDQFCLGAARTVREGPLGSLDAGATYKLSRVSFRPFSVEGEGSYDYGSISRGSLDLGLRWRSPWSVDVAWVLRDALRPRYEFIAGSGGYRVPALNELATVLRWNRESSLCLGWAQQAGDRAQMSLGLEITFFDVFAVRSGVRDVSKAYQAQQSPNYDILSERPPHDFSFDGGVGVYHKGFYVDAAAQTNHDLGVSYRASVRFPFGRGGSR